MTAPAVDRPTVAEVRAELARAVKALDAQIARCLATLAPTGRGTTRTDLGPDREARS